MSFCYYYLRPWGGLHWRGTRAAAPAASFRLLSYCQNPGVPPPSRLAGALTYGVSGDRDPNGSKPLIPNSEVASILRRSTPYSALAWLPLPYLPMSLLFCEIQYPRRLRYCGCIPWKTMRTSIYLLSGSPSVTPPRPTSVVAVPIHNEWSPTSLASSPAFAATWRSAARASGYLHSLTSLPHRYDDKGALSDNVGYTDSGSTMRATARPPAPTPERVPEASSRVRTITHPCWAWSPLWPRKRTSMLVARFRCSEVNRRSLLHNATSLLIN